MQKNVASQSIGAQMVSASDGSAFTGSVTVYITGDNGTQAIGSVGSGACTHEGNGYHSYAPSQGETNYDHIAFTFIGTGAIPATIQLFTEIVTPAIINAQVLDVLNTDTFSEPGQVAPPGSPTIREMIHYLYKSWRNRVTQTASQLSVYNDDGTTVGQKSTVSDNGTTYDRGEMASGA